MQGPRKHDFAFFLFAPSAWSSPAQILPTLYGPPTPSSVLTTRNVVTGVFCHSALESAQQDHSSIVQNILENLGVVDGFLGCRVVGVHGVLSVGFDG